MDVTLVRSSMFDLPSNQRVGALVHDGTSDLRLWPGPGADSDLNEMYGGGLQAALDTERDKLGVKAVPLGSVARIHPGRLHCDFLAWTATRPPEPGTRRQPAPDREALRQAVLATLAFVAERNVRRIAFGALGAGPGELGRAERLAIVVHAAHEYEEGCFRDGRPPVVEEVLVCEPLGSVMRDVQRLVARLAKAAEPPAPRSRETAAKKTPRRRSTSGGSRRKPARPALDPEEVARFRSTAERYDMRRTYVVGDWFMHPKFGVGRVESVTDRQAVGVLFEDGEVRNMVHARG